MSQSIRPRPGTLWSAALNGPLQVREQFTWSDNLNSEWLSENQKILVVADDEPGFGGESCAEHGIVLWITAARLPRGRRGNHCRLFAEPGDHWQGITCGAAQGSNRLPGLFQDPGAGEYPNPPPRHSHRAKVHLSAPAGTGHLNAAVEHSRDHGLQRSSRIWQRAALQA
jgi:hypothetical protein